MPKPKGVSLKFLRESVPAALHPRALVPFDVNAQAKADAEAEYGPFSAGQQAMSILIHSATFGQGRTYSWEDAC